MDLPATKDLTINVDEYVLNLDEKNVWKEIAQIYTELKDVKEAREWLHKYHLQSRI